MAPGVQEVRSPADGQVHLQKPHLLPPDTNIVTDATPKSGGSPSIQHAYYSLSYFCTEKVRGMKKLTLCTFGEVLKKVLS